mmetsp:Transcript_51071/g.95647  ORF Transcript_51071/g.95647 Transcript_51071/m.95647 type:complete len:208 (+) Transcript_51071:1248-1871(+)
MLRAEKHAEALDTAGRSFQTAQHVKYGVRCQLGEAEAYKAILHHVTERDVTHVGDADEARVGALCMGHAPKTQLVIDQVAIGPPGPVIDTGDPYSDSIPSDGRGSGRDPNLGTVCIDFARCRGCPWSIAAALSAGWAPASTGRKNYLSGRRVESHGQPLQLRSPEKEFANVCGIPPGAASCCVGACPRQRDEDGAGLFGFLWWKLDL